MPLHLHLCDRNTPLCDAWSREFFDLPLVTVHLDDFFSVEADVLCAGGNSHGFLTVGLELAISLKIGWHLQERLRAVLRSEHDGLLPVGQAVIIPTDDRRWPRLIFAPTMWVPMDVSETIHPYLAARAAFQCWRRLEVQEKKVWHMLMPGLGTGLGRVHPRSCALQLRRAYEEIVLLGKTPPLTLDEASDAYQEMLYGHDDEEEPPPPA